MTKRSFEEYLRIVMERNRETYDDGHIIEFGYTEIQIIKYAYYFKKCYEDNLSPYKALTFFYDEIESKNDKNKS